MPTTTTNFGWSKPNVADPIDADLWGGQLNANLDAQDTTLKTIQDNALAAAAYVNVGDMKVTARSSAPALWLLARGQAVSRATYSALFAAIGTTYGVGDGATTFNLPDLQGRVVAGLEALATRLTSGVSGVDGATLGASGGNQNIHQHTHTATVTDPGHSHTISGPAGRATSGGSVLVPEQPNANNTFVTNTSTTGITVSNTNAGTGSSQNVQPTIVLNWLIFAGV